MIHLLRWHGRCLIRCIITGLVFVALCGCQAKTPPAAPTAKARPVAAGTAQGTHAKPPTRGRELTAVESGADRTTNSAIDSRPRPSSATIDSRPLSAHDRGTLVDLVAAAKASEFELPQLDE